VNRSDLIDAFGSSLRQASTDLSRYLAVPPENMTYDKSAKAYIRGSDFSPHFLQPDARRYLSRFRSIVDDIWGASDTWIGQFSAFDATPTLARAINAKILRSVVASIRRSKSIENRYQTLSSLDSKGHWIVSHATGFDDFRWHARAFCYIDSTFKGFLLSQILEIRCTKPGKASLRADADWQEFVILEIGLRPVLSDAQKKVVSLDYGMKSGKTKIKAQRVFHYYSLKRPGLDTDLIAHCPQDQQIILLNASNIGVDLVPVTLRHGCQNFSS
jgi:hypothetical protein